MPDIETLLQRSAVHPEWRDILGHALAAVDPDYLLAAFRRDRGGLRFLLLGESPYPRAESANGIAFYDAAVGSLWSDQGLSKAVNRATSLRNLVKTAILAERLAVPGTDGKLGQGEIAAMDKSGLVATLDELFANLHAAGFLMFNATPVLHAARKPVQEARYWHGFLDRLLAAVAPQVPTLLLWGKIANLVEALPASRGFDRIVCEHPYNLSFIDNPDMRALFACLGVLQKPG